MSKWKKQHDSILGMAENNASWKRPLHLKRETLMAAASIYQAMYGQENPNDPGQPSIPATFQIVFFIGIWDKCNDFCI